MTAQVQILEPREVPLGGPRAMTVRRTLPQRRRSFIGAWCFVDHYGPDDVAVTGGMMLPPHPHTGLQTVSWLFTGAIVHADSSGGRGHIPPGVLSLMTAGRAITHSEYTTDDTTVLHGVQLWVALPGAERFVEPGYERYEPAPVTGPGWEARVFMGSLLGATSPVRTFSCLVGAELRLAAGTSLDLEVDPAHEHGVLVDAGAVRFAGGAVGRDELGYVAPGARSLRLEADEDSRVVLLGGTPLGEEIVMWWNFIGRDHDEVAAYRANYQRAIGRDEPGVTDPGQFTIVPDEAGNAPLPAPPLPNLRLRSRA